MSKWISMAYEEALDMIDHVKYAYNSPNFVRGSYTACRWFDAVKKALEIAKRVEKAEANVYEQYCKCCVNVGICRERDEMCAEASYWLDGYDTAIESVRGEDND